MAAILGSNPDEMEDNLSYEESCRSSENGDAVSPLKSVLKLMEMGVWVL